MTDVYRITKFTAENFKRLTAVEIDPKGDVIELTGKNDAGKSSILDAIDVLIRGLAAAPDMPIRLGEDAAYIRCHLGELIAERRFTKKGSTLAITKADGARFPSPQAMFDGFLGALSFDPVEFANKDAKAQFEMLRALVKLDVDLEELDNLNRGDFARRTDINREAKGLRAQAEAIRIVDGLPDAPIDIAPLMDELTRAAQHNANIESRKMRRQKVADDAQGHRRHASDLMARAARLRQEAEEIEAKAKTADGQAEELEQRLAQAEALPEPIDAEDLRRKIGIAQTDNKHIEAKLRRAQLETDAEAKEKQAKDITTQMEGREKAKRTAIAAAKMPIDGLGFADGMVTYNGVPFSQASSGGKIRVSLAIAMAANPKLRVILIRQGSLLDTDNFAIITEMAKARGYQVWIESVQAHGEMGVLIEEGRVAAVDGARVEKGAPEKAEAKQGAMQL